MTAVLSTNLRSPDLLDVFAIANELLASLVISSKNHESLCEEQKLKAKQTGCCRGFISYGDTQLVMTVQIQGRGTSNTSQATRQPQTELPAGEWAGWAHPALGWQWPNSSHCHPHVWIPCRDSDRADMNVGVFLHSYILLHRKGLDTESETVLL